MALAVFYVLALVTLGGAIGVVTTRNIVHAALFLLAALGGVAGFFALLYAEFLALAQVLIYGGAVVIVILFALMLTRRGELELMDEHKRWPLAAAVSFGLFAVMAAAFIVDAARYNADVRTSVSLDALGAVLFERWAAPFEIASLVLLVALIGAIVIARSGGRDER